MKRLIPILGLLVLCAPFSRAAEVHVAHGNGFCSASTSAGNMSGTCTALATKTFTYTAATLNNAVTFFIGCAATSPAPTVTLTASGWTLTALGGGVTGPSGSYVALFGAIAPNTAAATFTITFSKSCASFMSDLEEEYNGNDTTGGTTTFDATNSGNGSGSCSITVTPANNNDGVAGFCQDTVTAAGSGYTIGANDTSGDQGEFKILAGGSGVAQTVNFTGSGTWAEMAVTIKPAAAAGCTGLALGGITTQHRGCT